MPEAAERDKQQDQLHAIQHAMESGSLAAVRPMLNDLHPAEVAHLLESLRAPERYFVWKLVDPDYDGRILAHVNEEVRAGLIRNMETRELVAATEGLDLDDLADILQDLPDAVIQEVLQSMDKQNRQRLESVLAYPEDSAGGLMNIDAITVRADVTLDVVLRYLRLRGSLPELTDSLIVVNRFDRYLGMLPLTTLLTTDPNRRVADVADHSVEGIPPETHARDVAALFEDRDLVSAPVVAPDGTLLGRITIDDVVDFIRDEAEHSLRSMAGLSEDTDMFAPVVVSTRRRAVWLGVSLVAALLAASVIRLFEGTLEQIVALAVLMPVVASMGGVAGSQTLTLVIRGLALGQVGSANARWLLAKEFMVGVLNGLLWAVVVAIVAGAWFQSMPIGLIIGMAILVNLSCAALAGFTIPLLMRRLGIDPALAGTVALTTVTDVVGFFTFLGLATVLLI